MCKRDIWKISLRPLNPSSYQGNMYILIATESARNTVKEASKVWSGFAFTFSFRNVFFLHLSDHQTVRIALLRLPCAPGKFEMSRHCRDSTEDDDDGGDPATKVPRESIDDHSTRRQTTVGPPCLCWTSRNVFFVIRINKTRSCWSHEALTRCTLDSATTMLRGAARIRKDDACSLRSTSRQTFMRRNWCTMPLATESTPAPSAWTPLPLPARRMPKLLLIIQRLSPMTATRHDMAFKRLASIIEEWITDDACCIMSLLNHTLPYIWLNAPPWIWCRPNSRWGIQPDAKVTWMSLKPYTSVQIMPSLCQQK